MTQRPEPYGNTYGMGLQKALLPVDNFSSVFEGKSVKDMVMDGEASHP